MSLMSAAIAKKRVFRGLISAGYRFSLVVNTNKTVFSWGNNSYGNLGDNSTTSRLTPVGVLGGVKTFCQISAGSNLHSLAIDNNGRAWAWGGNVSGELGDNSTTSRLTPVSVLGAVKTFCHISAGGGSHSLTIDKYGRAWGWGNNSRGQVGDNSITSRLTPVSVLGEVKTFCRISAGTRHSLAIDKNGRAWGWGYNFDGHLGDNSITSRLTPVSVAGAVKTFCKISAGGSHSLAIDKNGRVWGWGANNGAIGNNSTISRLTPVSVCGVVKTFCQIDAGFGVSYGIDKNGRAWGWGSAGLTGDGTRVTRLTPVSVAGAVKTFCAIDAGSGHAIALEKNGKIWVWGSNENGALGNNLDGPFSEVTPVSVCGAVKTFCTITAGWHMSFAIDKNGRAWGWGGGYGQGTSLGDGSTSSRITPVSVAGTIKTFCTISSGDGYALAIDKNGRVWGWGYNGIGELGDDSTNNRVTPVSVAGAVKTFCKISVGNGHSLAIDKNGRAWGWGYNSRGQVGDNSTTSRLTPVSIAGAVKTFCQIDAGIQRHSLAIDKNGRAWGWGYNSTGKIGDNSTTSRLTPVSVLGAVKTFCKITAGFNHSAAIDKNGRAWGWGNNGFNQLGDNTSTQRLTPVSVAGAVKTFCQISAGIYGTLAIDKNGRAWGWGSNIRGELGTGFFSNTTPRSIAGVVKTFCTISTKLYHSLAIDKNGRAWAWGSNEFTSLGNNVMLCTTTPVQVCNI